MMKALRNAKYVSMDTEFPGTVFKPDQGGSFDKYAYVR